MAVVWIFFSLWSLLVTNNTGFTPLTAEQKIQLCPTTCSLVSSQINRTFGATRSNHISLKTDCLFAHFYITECLDREHCVFLNKETTSQSARWFRGHHCVNATFKEEDAACISSLATGNGDCLRLYKRLVAYLLLRGEQLEFLEQFKCCAYHELLHCVKESANNRDGECGLRDSEAGVGQHGDTRRNSYNSWKTFLLSLARSPAGPATVSSNTSSRSLSPSRSSESSAEQDDALDEEDAFEAQCSPFQRMDTTVCEEYFKANRSSDRSLAVSVLTTALLLNWINASISN